MHKHFWNNVFSIIQLILCVMVCLKACELNKINKEVEEIMEDRNNDILGQQMNKIYGE